MVPYHTKNHMSRAEQAPSYGTLLDHDLHVIQADKTQPLPVSPMQFPGYLLYSICCVITLESGWASFFRADGLPLVGLRPNERTWKEQPLFQSRAIGQPLTIGEKN